MRFRRLPDRTIEFSLISPWELKTLRSVPGLADPSGVPGAHERLFPDPIVKADADPDHLADWREYVVPDLAELFRSSLDVITSDVMNAEETEVIEEPARKASGRKRRNASADEDEDNDDDDLDELEDLLSAGDDSEDGDEEEDLDGDEVEDEKDEDSDEEEEEDHDDEDGDEGEESESPRPPRMAWRFIVPAENIDHWYRGVNQARLVMSQRFGIDSEQGISAEQIFSTGNFERYLQYEMLTALASWLVPFILE